MALFPDGRRVNLLVGIVDQQETAWPQAFAAFNVAADAGSPVPLFGLFQSQTPPGYKSAPVGAPVTTPPFLIAPGEDGPIPVLMEVSPQQTGVTGLAACDAHRHLTSVPGVSASSALHAALAVPSAAASSPGLVLDPNAFQSPGVISPYLIRAQAHDAQLPGWRFSVLPASPFANNLPKGPARRALGDAQLALLHEFGDWTTVEFSNGYTTGEKVLIGANLAQLAIPHTVAGAAAGALLQFGLNRWRQGADQAIADQMEPLPTGWAVESPALAPLDFPDLTAKAQP